MTSAAVSSLDFLASSLAAGSGLHHYLYVVQGRCIDVPTVSPESGLDMVSPHAGWTCSRNSTGGSCFACKDLLGHSSLLILGNKCEIVGRGGEEKLLYNTSFRHLEGLLLQAENFGMGDIFELRNATSCNASKESTFWDVECEEVLDAHEMDDDSNVVDLLAEYFLNGKPEFSGVITQPHGSSNDYTAKGLPEMLWYAIGYLMGVSVQLILSFLLVRLCCR
jgi:hypothetical protein